LMRAVIQRVTSASVLIAGAAKSINELETLLLGDLKTNLSYSENAKRKPQYRLYVVFIISPSMLASHSDRCEGLIFDT